MLMTTQPWLRTVSGKIAASPLRVDILLAAMDGNSSQISLRQRGRQALARTGWLSPTHDVLPAAGAAVATYVVTLVTAPTGTPVDKRAVGFPLAAGVIALVGVFLVVNLIEFTVNFAKAGPRLRIEADRRRQDSLIATAQDTTIMEWLRQQLGRQALHVCFAAVFGSVTQAYPTRDVDVVVQLDAVEEGRIRELGLRLKGLGHTFETEFTTAGSRKVFAIMVSARMLHDREDFCPVFGGASSNPA